EEGQARIRTVCDRLVDVDTDKDTGPEPLRTMSLLDVVDSFWPSSDGWRVVSTEPTVYYVVLIFEHDVHGVAAMVIGAGTPGCGQVTVASWDTLSISMRCRNTAFSHHVQAAPRLDVLDVFTQLHR